MAGKKSIESRKTQINSIDKSIEQKGKKIEELEKAYDDAYDKRLEVENDENLDEEVKAAYRDVSANKFRELEQKGKDASDDLNEEVEQLKEVQRENQEAIDANRRSQKRAQGIDLILGKINIDSNTAEKFESHADALEGVSEEITNAQSKITEYSNRAKSLSKHRGG